MDHAKQQGLEDEDGYARPEDLRRDMTQRCVHDGGLGSPSLIAACVAVEVRNGTYPHTNTCSLKTRSLRRQMVTISLKARRITSTSPLPIRTLSLRSLPINLFVRWGPMSRRQLRLAMKTTPNLFTKRLWTVCSDVCDALRFE